MGWQQPRCGNPLGWGQSRDWAPLAQRSWQPQGSQEIFLLPILSEPFSDLIPSVYIPIPAGGQSQGLEITGPSYFLGWKPLVMRDVTPGDGGETRIPSQPHPSKAQQHPKGKCPRNAYQPILPGQGRAPRLPWGTGGTAGAACQLCPTAGERGALWGCSPCPVCAAPLCSPPGAGWCPLRAQGRACLLHYPGAGFSPIRSRFWTRAANNQ